MNNTIKSVGLLGGCGGFGRLFARQLGLSGVQVTTLDLDTTADVVLDVRKDTTALLEVLPGLDALLLCVPEDLALTVLETLAKAALNNILVVDICSVKSNICAAAENMPGHSEYVSIHPMFGPERPLPGQNLVMVPVRPGNHTQSLRRLFADWQLKIIDTDAATHDRVTSLVQVLAHATLISFAQAQAQVGVADNLLEAMATPIYRALSETAQGLLGENPYLYHNIQTANPNGAAARAALLAAVEQTVATLGQADAEEVVALFARLRGKG